MKLQAQIFRDGTSQSDRQQRALDPDYVAIDEKTLADGIKFVQTYTKHLTYFNDLNQPEGDWTAFFQGNAQQIADLLSSIDAQEIESIPKLSQPHLALFLAFIKLLNYPQQQFKDLTQRRLDFYYRQVLQLVEKAAHPDRVHVVFSLASNQTEYLLPAKTPLNAGKDAQGKDLHYLTDIDLFITPAQVASIKTLSVEKQDIDLQYIREKQGFEAMLRWAIGRPNQGDELPLPMGTSPQNNSFETIINLFWKIQDQAALDVGQNDQDYILNQLCFSTIDEFKFCLDIYTRENKLIPSTQPPQDENSGTIIPPTKTEWQQVYRLVEKAYRQKINQDRRNNLKQVHQENSQLTSNEAFLKLWRFALGDPLSGDPLPFFREQTEVNLTELLAEIKGENPEDADRYIQELLLMSVADFVKIMEIQTNFADNLAAPEWDEVYRLLERAQTQKRNFTYPPISRTELQGIHAEAISDTNGLKPLKIERFHPFMAQSDSLSESVQFLGIAIASPILHLQEGNRTIMVTIGCKAETFKRSELEDFYKQQNAPFMITLSSEKGWLSIESDQLSYALGDFFLESSLKSFNSTQLTLIYQGEENTFNNSDQGKYLQFANGSLYHIDAVLGSGSQVQLSNMGQLEGTEEVLKRDSLELRGGTLLSNAEIKIMGDLIEVTTRNNAFAQTDINQFIVSQAGDIYQIKEFVNARKVSVTDWGYLPSSNRAEIKKYEQITFAIRGTPILTPLSPQSVKLGDHENGKFTRTDINTLLAWVNGEVYQITGLGGEKQGRIKLVGKIRRLSNQETTIDQYSASGIYFNSLQFKITLDDTQPSILALPQPDNLVAFSSDDPIIRIGFNDDNKTFYKIFKDICLEKVKVQVTVKDLKKIQLRNDRSILNPKSSFEPFGSQPTVGNSLYFTHPEIVSKPLDSLSLNLEWIGLPENFVTHYQAYFDSQLLSSPLNNNSFKAKLELFLNRTWHDIAERSLFNTDEDNNNQLLSQITINYDQADFLKIPQESYTSFSLELSSNDLLEQSRYFRLELIRPDFQTDLYPLVLTKVARAGENDLVRNTQTKINSLTVYPPYIPKIKSIEIAYKASAEIDLLTNKKETSSGQIFQLHPFGYVNLQKSVNLDDYQQNYYLLPQYSMDGELYIGLRNLTPPQSLTLFFQMVSGSGNADLSNPTIVWSYLTRDRWKPFQTDEILFDSTNGLLDSGIIHFTIPEAASRDNSLLPREFHWIKATVAENTAAIPDNLDIRTQAVTATFIDQDNDPDHLSTPLKANSITVLVQRPLGIETVSQPYSSFGGKRKESDRLFYTRVSERLRHKQRAVTRWDYEHLILEKFPQIYKVKCLTQAEQFSDPKLAQVTIVVIPNLANTAPFLPLEPKVPQYLLREIEAYLQARTSPFVKVVVKNPHYEQIKYRIAVRFRSTSDQGYYIKTLNEELIRFLSPWAYEEQSDISFGSSIHSSAVIHFIETRSYVDYVANLKLIEQISLSNFPNSQPENSYQVNPSNLAQVKQADSILVSAPEHIIDLIATANYSAETFEGIDYMVIGVDFVIQ